MNRQGPRVSFSAEAGRLVYTMGQFIITPAAGKRLIAKGLAAHPCVRYAISNGTLVIVAGTTNGYVAQEILSQIGQEGLERRRFFRGVVLPPSAQRTKEGRLPDQTDFPGDVVITGGRWLKGKTIFDMAGQLKEGDLILKGANALDLARGQAAVLIGHPQAGTTGVILQAVAGRRVKLIVPVGLEKRIHGDLHELTLRLNGPGWQGPRLLALPGEVFTEIDAIRILTGASASLFAAGGVGGAEGCVWLAVEGSKEQLDATQSLMDEVCLEPAFSL